MHWSFGKYWFTDLYRPSKQTSVQLTINLEVKLTVIDINFPKF